MRRRAVLDWPAALRASPQTKLGLLSRWVRSGGRKRASTMRFATACIQRCRSSGAIQFVRRMPSRPFCEIAVNTSMFGMPVVKYAVLTSPHGMPTARRSPAPKSIRRVCEPSSTATIWPSRRTREPPPTDSIVVFAVPLLIPELPSKPSVRCVASGSAASTSRRRCRSARRRSRRRDTARPRAVRLLVDAVRQLEDVDLAGDVEVVDVRGEAALHHRPCCRGERSGAMQDGGHAVERAHQCSVIVERRILRSGSRAPPRVARLCASSGRRARAACRGRPPRVRSAPRCTRSRHRAASSGHPAGFPAQTARSAVPPASVMTPPAERQIRRGCSGRRSCSSRLQ